jgi:enoyl-CoA hydratase
MSVMVERQGAVLIVTLNKPAQPNALDGETMSGVGVALADAESDDSVAVVVLTGAGDRSFCAGMDLKVLLPAGSRPGAADGPGLGVLIGGTYSKPVIVSRSDRFGRLDRPLSADGHERPYGGRV